MTTQTRRLFNFAIVLVGVSHIEFDEGSLKKIKSADIGAVYKDIETGKMHVIGLKDAKNFKPGENQVCLLSSPRIKSADGEQRLRATTVTKPDSYSLTDKDRSDFVEMANCIRGPYAGAHHDVTDGQKYSTSAWVTDGENNETYIDQFVDATVAKDNDGAPVMLLLLGKDPEQPILRAFNVDGSERDVKLVGKVDALKSLQPWSIARPFTDETGTYTAINAQNGTMALLHLQYADKDQFKFDVTSVVNVDGEIKVETEDGKVGLKALIGLGSNGKYGVFTQTGIPMVLDDVQTAALMADLDKANKAQQFAA